MKRNHLEAQCTAPRQQPVKVSVVKIGVPAGEYLVVLGGDNEASTLTWAAPTGSTTYTRDAHAVNAAVAVASLSSACSSFSATCSSTESPAADRASFWRAVVSFDGIVVR